MYMHEQNVQYGFKLMKSFNRKIDQFPEINKFTWTLLEWVDKNMLLHHSVCLLIPGVNVSLNISLYQDLMHASIYIMISDIFITIPFTYTQNR